MSDKLTKQPWRLAPFEDTYQVPRTLYEVRVKDWSTGLVGDYRGCVVAYIPGGYAEDVDTAAVAMANADLIASAPTLKAEVERLTAENVALRQQLDALTSAAVVVPPLDEQPLALDLEFLVERMDIPSVYNQELAKLREAIVAALRAPKQDTDGQIAAHICNEVMKDFTPKFGIGYSYEDRNVESCEAAEAFAEYLNQLVPGAFVLVDTGDYLIPHCGEDAAGFHRTEKADCQTYDAHYWYYLVSSDDWRHQRDDVERRDAEWRAEHMKCKITGETVAKPEYKI